MGSRKKVGLILNPVAGIGGAVGLKGSDGEEIQKAAFERGAVCRAGSRAKTALSVIADMKEELLW